MPNGNMSEVVYFFTNINNTKKISNQEKMKQKERNNKKEKEKENKTFQSIILIASKFLLLFPFKNNDYLFIAFKKCKRLLMLLLEILFLT